MPSGHVLSCSRLFRRLKNGAHGQLVELYAARRVEVGLARQGTWRSLNVVGDLLDWMARRGPSWSSLMNIWWSATCGTKERRSAASWVIEQR